VTAAPAPHRLARRAMAALVAAVALALPAGAAHAADLYTVPGGYTPSSGIATTDDGRVVFGANGSGLPALALLTPTAVAPGTSDGIALAPTPNHSGGSPAIKDVASSQGNVWFTRGDRVVGRAALSAGGVSSIDVVQAPGGVDVQGIATAPDGSAWFAEIQSLPTPAGPPYYGNRIARIDAAMNITEMRNLALQGEEFSSVRWSARPYGVAVALDGTPWFTQSDPGNGGYRIARVVDQLEGTYAEYSPPCVSSNPCSGTYTGEGLTDLTLDHTGAVWYVNRVNDSIGRLAPGGASVAEYPLGSLHASLAGGRPRAVETARDGTVWLAVQGNAVDVAANAIVRIAPSATPTATIYDASSTPGTYTIGPSGVAPDKVGNDVWFTGVSPSGAPGRVGRIVGALAGGPPGPDDPPAPPTPPRVEEAPIEPARTGNAKPPKVRVRGSSLNLDQVCIGPAHDRCAVLFLVRGGVRTPNFPGARTGAYTSAKAKAKVRRNARGKAKRKRVRYVVLGRARVTLAGGESKRVTIKLNRKGRRLLARAPKGRLRTQLLVRQRTTGGKLRQVTKRSVTFKSSPKRKRGATKRR